MDDFVCAQLVCTEKIVSVAAVDRAAATAIVKAYQIFGFYIIRCRKRAARC